MTIASMERRLMMAALERSRGSRRKTAKELGIDTSTLFRKIKWYGIDMPLFDGRRR